MGEIRYIVDQNEYNLRSFWEDLGKAGSLKYKNEFAITDILKKLREEFVVLVEDLHGLLSGTPPENHVIEIKDTKESRIIDLTINFPANMTPLKKQEKKDSKEPGNNKENVDNKEKDDTSQKNKSKDKDGTNVMWERQKKFFWKKREVMNVLHPYLDKEQRSDEEYKEFANHFFEKSLGFARYL